MSFWNRNKRWIIALIVLGCIFALLRAAGFDLVRVAAWFGVAGLILTLLPSNLMRRNWFRSKLLAELTRVRRDIGITTGLVFVVHAVSALATYTDLSLESAFVFWGTPAITLGVVSLMVLVLMLATSGTYVTRALGPNWKRVHSLVWFMVPLAFTHALFASRLILGETSLVPVIGLGAILFFVFIEWIAIVSTRQTGSNRFRHVILSTLGAIVGVLTWYLFL